VSFLLRILLNSACKVLSWSCWFCGEYNAILSLAVENQLIGNKAATDLELLHIRMLNTLDVNTDNIISSFKDRFTGLGKLKNFQIKLHIDHSVQPIAQPVRKIP
jgi:hypothetical protein